MDSLAVLPFLNESADPNMEYLSDGITESLINSLSQWSNLRVMARSSVFRYKGKEVDPQKVGRDLRVQAAVTGRVQQRGDTLMIAAEMVDVEKGSQLWGSQYSRKVADIFAIQEEISREISEKLRRRLTGEEQRRLTKRYTENPEAYQAYLKGRYYWNKRTEEASRKGIEYFQQAIEQDPGYALANVGLADSYNLVGASEILPPKEAFPRAKTAAMRALEIDNTLAEAHTSLAYLKFRFEWDWSGAESDFKRAIELHAWSRFVGTDAVPFPVHGNAAASVSYTDDHTPITTSVTGPGRLAGCQAQLGLADCLAQQGIRIIQMAV
jgi:TolB-like protein